jgi:hypothetical protein
MQMVKATTPLPRLFSIGHSDHEPDRLRQLLQAAAVTAVADVRSAPYSKRLPWFNRPELESGLQKAGMAYVFLGDLLGGRPAALSLYDADGRVNYERVRQTEACRRGLDRLLDGAERFTIALLCSEEDPLHCHRGLMIAPALAERGAAMSHLRGDGAVETAAALEARLLAETGVGQGVLDGLFAALVTPAERRQLLAEAYRLRARRWAFRLRPAEGGEAAGPWEEPVHVPPPTPLARPCF